MSPVRPLYLRTALCMFLLPILLLALTPAPASAAAIATGTTLEITTGTGNSGVTVTSISTGTVVTLTATVTSGTGAVPAGQVNFCDATAARCTDTHLVGVAYLTASGTATFTFIPSPGVHSYVAEYVGTSGITGPALTSATVYAASSSAASSLSVDSVPTTTSITQSGSAGAYTLKATVTGTGSTVGPTGKLSFLDTSNSNAVLGSATLGTATSSLSWTTPQSPATAAQPNSIVVADFNGDGIADLAIATNGISGGNGSVQILLGNGDGTFQAAKTYTGLPGIQLIVAAPFITGGPEDLLVVSNANTGSDLYATNALFFTGDGKGNFQAGTPFEACLDSVSAIVVGDFNGDGIPDFAVAGFINGAPVNGVLDPVPNVAITYGDGTGTIPATGYGCSAGSIFGIFNGSAAITGLGVGDFQGNGMKDIAAVQFGGAINILLGYSSAYPIPEDPMQIPQTAGSSPTGIAVGDFNGDGYADLAITNGGQNNVTILLGDGTGTNFTAAASPSTGSTPATIAVGDFNGDGIDDLAVANSGDGTVTILLGKGDGTFTAQPALTAGNTPVALAVGKFNGSGTADIAVANQNPAPIIGNTATVLLSQFTQTATATATNISPTGAGTTHLVDASYAGDSTFASSLSSTTSLSGYGGTETVTAAPTSLTFTGQAGNTSTAQTVTLTNTGTAVVNISSVSAGAGYTASSACGSSLAVGANCLISVKFAPTTTGTVIGSLTISDNATGSPQSVTLTGTATAPTPTITPPSLTFTSQVAGTTSAAQTVTVANASNYTVTINSVVVSAGYAVSSACGVAIGPNSSCLLSVTFAPTISGSIPGSVIIASDATGSPQTVGLSGTAATAPQISTTTSIAQSGSPGNYTLTATVVGSGDLTAAPTGTVSFLDTSNGNAVVATATLGASTSGTLTWTNTQTPATEPAPQSIVVGDFNGDGIPDIAAGSNGYVSVLIGKGDGTFKASNNLAALSNNQSMAAAVFVTGGPTGILTISNSASPTNNAQLILSDGNGGEIVEVPFSLPCGSASAVATADFNGDGNQDFAVVCQDAGNSVLAVFLGNGNGTFQAPTIIPTGSQIPAIGVGVGNFFGNGRADIAVVTAVANSSTLQTVSTYENDGHGNFSAGPSVSSTGTSPTSVVVADFNGDGKSDLALVNSGGNNVTILLSNGNGTFNQAASPQTGSSPSSIAVGDFNGNGIQDLAVSNSGDGTVTILLGKGDGTFATVASPPTGSTPSALAVGGFITGGRLGLAVANSGAVGGSVTVLNQQSTNTATATATGISPAGSGAHQVEASYPGDSNYAASVSGTTSLSSQALSTTLTLTPNPTSSTVGQQVLLTAILAPFSSGGNSTNGESVTFYSGSTSLGTGTLTSGVATLNTKALPTGTDSLTAKFAGDANFNASTSTAVSFVVSAAAQVAVPNVVGDTQSAATTAITAAGLVVGTVTTASSSTVASGNVISESPIAGTSVNSGSAVNLVVSTGSAQTPGYTLSANPSSLTIARGSTGSTVITLTPTGGFAGTVNFACGTLPTLVTCSFLPTSLTVPSSAPLTTTLTIGTTGTAGTVSAFLLNGPAGGVLPELFAVLILLPLGFTRRILRTKKAGSPWLACLLLLAGATLAAAGMLGMAGCGGSSKSSTPAGTYSIPINVTSGGTTVPLNLSITIQ